MESIFFALAFLAGAITVATPCIIMLLPPMLAGSVGSRLRPIVIVLGMSTIFVLMGGFFSAIGGPVAGPLIGYLRTFSIFVIIGLGAVLVSKSLNQKFVEICSIFVNKIMKIIPLKKGDAEPQGEQIQREGLIDAFILGLSLGFVWLPCIGLILGSMFMFVLMGGNILDGSLFLFAYSMGLGIPMLAIAYSGKLAAARVKGMAERGELLKKIAGIVLIMTGVSMLVGLSYVHMLTKQYRDSLLGVLLKYSPDFLDNLLKILF